MMTLCKWQVKFLVVALVSFSVASSAVHSRHIRSVDDSDDVTPPALLHSNIPHNATVPPPPPDGGAKTILESEAASVGTKQNHSSEVESPPLTPHMNIVSNDTLPVPKPAPEGKAGFGGPPALEPENKTIIAGGEVGVGENVEELGVGLFPTSKDGLLVSCRVCPPGYGVISSCTLEADTVCSKCPAGTFSKGFSATAGCAPCSVCASGFYQRTPCVADADVLCGACHSHGNGYGNEDFLRQCEGATISPTTTEEESIDVEVSTSGGMVLPVKSTTVTSTVSTVQQATQKPTAKTDVLAIEPHVREAHAKENEKDQEAGGFQWPILLAVIGSGVLFFIVGVITSLLCKRSAQKKKHNLLAEQGDPNDSVRNTSFRRTDNNHSPSQGSSGYHDADVTKPLNPGK